MEQLDDVISQDAPIWPIFGDLMAGLVGVFVLLLVWTLGIQLDLASSLEEEISKREAEEQRRIALEEALAQLPNDVNLLWAKASNSLMDLFRLG